MPIRLDPPTQRLVVWSWPLFVGLLLWNATAAAQIPYLEPLPWFGPPEAARLRFMDFSYDLFGDEKSDWTANRVGLAGYIPVSDRGIFFIRGYVLSFHRKDLPVLVRWPHIAGEDAEEGWPGETRSIGFASPELGLLGPIRLPLLGGSRWGLTVGLPIGRDELYPFASASFPLRLALRKELALHTVWRLNLVAGGLFHLDSSRSFFDGSAFPDGYWLAAGLSWQPGKRRWWNVLLKDDVREGRRTTLLTLQWWIPSGSLNAFGVGVTGELAGFADRPFHLQMTLTWRFVSPGAVVAETAEP